METHVKNLIEKAADQTLTPEAAMKYAQSRKWVWNKEKEGYVPALQEAI